MEFVHSAAYANIVEQIFPDADECNNYFLLFKQQKSVQDIYKCVDECNIDLASISGHKIYGPKGVGALYIRKKPRVRLKPIL